MQVVVRPARAEDDAVLEVNGVRVFVDVDRSPAEVITVYRTSKIDKYWRSES